jgi:hypothetical protein
LSNKNNGRAADTPACIYGVAIGVIELKNSRISQQSKAQ